MTPRNSLASALPDTSPKPARDTPRFERPAAEAPAANVLVFVQIPTHFREMIRVAELLQESPGYRPTVVFMAEYAGVAADIERCMAREIRVLTPRDFYRYLPVARRGRLERMLAAARSAWNGLETRSSDALAGVAARLSRALAGVVRALDRVARLAGYRIMFDRRNPFIGWWVAGLGPSYYRARHMLGSLARAGLRPARAAARPVVRVLGEGIGALRRARAQASARIRRGWVSATTSVRRRVARGTRWLLLRRVPPLRRMRWLAPLALPFRWPLNRLAVFVFGAIYRRHPEWLPADIRAQHYLERIVDRMLADNAIDAVVLPEDNFYYFTNLFVRAAHARGGVAVIVPFTIVNMLEWAEAFHDLDSHDAQILMNWPFARLFPAWCHDHKGRHLVMPVQQVLANEYLRTAPPIPWLINSGAADAIAAEGDFMKSYYLRAGIPERQIRLVGSLSDDVLHRALGEAAARRRALASRLGFDADRPVIVCALPPNQLAGDGRPQCSFTDYRAILECFVAPLEKLAGEYNVVVSLHPRILAADAAILEGRRLRVAPDNIAELIPLGALFIACCSATIRLAITCGIPVVNFDVYRYDYDDFKKAPGVVTIEEAGEYARIVMRLARDPAEYARVQALQRELAAHESLFDGAAGRRMIGLFDELLARRARRAA